MVRLAEPIEALGLPREERAQVEAALAEGEDRAKLIRTAIAKELKARKRTAVRTRRAASGQKMVKARLLLTQRTQDGKSRPVIFVETGNDSWRFKHRS